MLWGSSGKHKANHQTKHTLTRSRLFVHAQASRRDVTSPTHTHTQLQQTNTRECLCLPHLCTKEIKSITNICIGIFVDTSSNAHTKYITQIGNRCASVNLLVGSGCVFCSWFQFPVSAHARCYNGIGASLL